MKKILLMLLFLTIPAYAFSGNQTGTSKNILIIGDSLSAGYGMNLAYSWPKLLQQKLGKTNSDYKVINASISGSTTSNGLSVLPNALRTYHPVITIIELGGNDGLRGLDLSVIKNNLQKMIIMVQKNSRIILVGVRLPPNYGTAYTSAFNQIFRDLSAQYHTALVPLFLNGIDTNSALMQADGIHPNQSAQVILLNNIWPVLDKMLGLN